MDKQSLLLFYREGVQEASTKISGNIEERNYISIVNRTVRKLQDKQVKEMFDRAEKENWCQKKIIDTVLMIRYTANIAMIEQRNKIWPYDYMSFSRRIGELWEPFCKELFAHSIKELKVIEPPSFEAVQTKIKADTKKYIDSLPIDDAMKRTLQYYYNTPWSIVDSGGIKLKLDLHFSQKNSLQEEIQYHCDFKSGFSSNEKGNTNRLLSVASIYHAYNKKDRMVMFIRQREEENNHYLQSLKNSGYWEVFCADEAYEKMKEFTGFDLRKWLDDNACWKDDINKDLGQYLQKNNLLKYLTW